MIPRTDILSSCLTQRTVIQGTADANTSGKLSKAEVSKTVEFCYKAFTPITAAQKDGVAKKLEALNLDAQSDDKQTQQAIDELEKSLTPEENEVLTVMRSRRLVREDGFNVDSFVLNSIDGLKANMERGSLGLVEAEAVKFSKAQMYDLSYLEGKKTGIVEQTKGIPKTNGASKTSADDIIENLGRLIAPLKGDGTSPDEASKHQVMNALHDAAYDLETTFDTLGRLANTGRQLPVIKVGIQLGIFKTLVAAKRPLGVVDLSEPTGADPALLSRIIRYLAANRLVSETAKETYEANRETNKLADDAFEGGMEFFYGVSNPVAHELPNWLAQHQFKNLQGNEGGRTVFQQTQNVDLELYPWLKTQPSMLKNFQRLMTVPRYSEWLSVVEVQKPNSSDGKSFVDVGGNVGHQCKRLLAAHPELAGSIVFQDLEETIKAAPPVKGIEAQAHDFFKPNPVKG